MKLRSVARPGDPARSALAIALALALGGSHAACFGPEISAISLVTGSTNGTTEGEDWAIGLLVGVVVAAALGVATVAMEDDISLHLEEHRIELERAVARGDGLFVRDVAALLDLGEEGAAEVGAALKSHHAEISAVLEDPAPLGPARVRALGRAVCRALAASPTLAPHASDEVLTRRLREVGVL